MRYLMHIRLDDTADRKSIFPVDAKDEEEALERLKLRLPPHQRENFIVDAINIDPSSINDDDPYGVFGGE